MRTLLLQARVAVPQPLMVQQLLPRPLSTVMMQKDTAMFPCSQDQLVLLRHPVLLSCQQQTLLTWPVVSPPAAAVLLVTAGALLEPHCS